MDNMTASQLSNVVSKALNRDVICIEKDRMYLFFLSEKDKTNYLTAPTMSENRPAAKIEVTYSEEPVWDFSFLNDKNQECLSPSDYTDFLRCVTDFIREWFLQRFMQSALVDSGFVHPDDVE